LNNTFFSVTKVITLLVIGMEW